MGSKRVGRLITASSSGSIRIAMNGAYVHKRGLVPLVGMLLKAGGWC